MAILPLFLYLVQAALVFSSNRSYPFLGPTFDAISDDGEHPVARPADHQAAGLATGHG